MKKEILSLHYIIWAVLSYGQKDPVKEITRLITPEEAQAHLSFLAADEMRGRDTGSPEIDIAANYLATQFQIAGLSKVPGMDSYFQSVALENIHPATGGELVVGEDSFKFKDHFIIFSGSNQEWRGEIVYAGYGSPDELERANVKGKLVVTLAGKKDSEGNPMAVFYAAGDKFKDAKAAGASGLVEIFASTQIPWPALVNYFANNKSTKVKSEGEDVPHLWLKDNEGTGLKKLREGSASAGSIRIEGIRKEPVPGKNVIALLVGSDPKLKDEYLVVSAHYDHVGVTKRANQTDSIFNGARDNAIGVVGMLSTAKYFTHHPPKRSVIFIALTAEEKGLLGSKFYTEHPVVPLNQTVFNFNCDGAGYNDTSVATVIGLERTTAQEDLSKACEAFGLKAGLDPVPEQNLFERSDNYNFAVKGVPAIDFAPGIKAFDAELNKYYHQPADEVSSLDFDYLSKYFRAYVYANVLLANNPKAPTWKSGDKFEVEAKKLYNH